MVSATDCLPVTRPASAALVAVSVTAGRAAHPAVTLTTSNTTLAGLVTGRQSVAEAIEQGHLKLKGSKTAVRRMFDVTGFPLVRLGS